MLSDKNSKQNDQSIPEQPGSGGIHTKFDPMTDRDTQADLKSTITNDAQESITAVQISFIVESDYQQFLELRRFWEQKYLEGALMFKSLQQYEKLLTASIKAIQESFLENDSLRQQHQAALDKLLSERAALNDKLGSLHARLDELSDRYEQSNMKLRSIRDEHVDVVKRIEKLTTDAVKDTLAENQGIKEQLQSELSSSAPEVSKKAQRQLAMLEHMTPDRYQQIVNTLPSGAEALEYEYNALLGEKQPTRTPEELAELKLPLEERAINALKEEVVEKLSASKTHDVSIEDLEHDFDDIMDKFRGNLQQRVDNMKQLDVLKSRQEALVSTRSTVLTERHAITQEIGKVTRDIQQASQEANRLDARIQDVQSEFNHAPSHSGGFK